MIKENDSSQIILLDKPAGLTPLQAINTFREKKAHYDGVTLSYAGRLDPMAEGLLLILVGDENKRRKHYEHLPKTYEFEMLLGISTDSYDVMGKITSTNNVSKEAVQGVCQSVVQLTSSLRLPYPPYSSKRIQGHPLFWYARNNTLDTIPYPYQEITMSDISFLEERQIITTEVLHNIQTRITAVSGEFRQQEILDVWEKTLEELQNASYTILKWRATVSSGSYIRGIVHHLETLCAVPLVTFSIKRMSIGDYSLRDAVTLNKK